MHLPTPLLSVQRTSRTLFLAFLFTLTLFPACRKDKSPKPCGPVTVLGDLTLRCDGKYEFQTSGGGNILIDLQLAQIIVSHKDYPNFKIEFWGAVLAGQQQVVNFNHENLNGKHIKDRLLATRTLVLPDGSKLTMASTGMDKEIHTISIYDGNESHQFDFATKKVKHSSLDAAKAQQLDAAEPDGEAATFSMDNNGLEFFNSYNELTPGNKVSGRVLLGTIERAQPTQVNDYFDDPRLGHT